MDIIISARKPLNKQFYIIHTLFPKNIGGRVKISNKNLSQSKTVQNLLPSKIFNARKFETALNEYNFYSFFF